MTPLLRAGTGVSIAAGRSIIEATLMTRPPPLQTLGSRAGAWRAAVAAGAAIGLLLAAPGAATAQHPLSCADRTVQVKAAEDHLAESERKTAEEAQKCEAAPEAQRRSACAAFHGAQVTRDNRRLELDRLKAEPAWQDCLRSSRTTPSPGPSPTPIPSGLRGPSPALECGSRSCAPDDRPPGGVVMRSGSGNVAATAVRGGGKTTAAVAARRHGASPTVVRRSGGDTRHPVRARHEGRPRHP